MVDAGISSRISAPMVGAHFVSEKRFLPCLFMAKVPLFGLLMFSDEELGVRTVQNKGDENSGWGDGPYSQFRVHLR